MHFGQRLIFNLPDQMRINKDISTFLHPWTQMREYLASDSPVSMNTFPDGFGSGRQILSLFLFCLHRHVPDFFELHSSKHGESLTERVNFLQKNRAYVLSNAKNIVTSMWKEDDDELLNAVLRKEIRTSAFQQVNPEEAKKIEEEEEEQAKKQNEPKKFFHVVSDVEKRQEDYYYDFVKPILSLVFDEFFRQMIYWDDDDIKEVYKRCQERFTRLFAKEVRFLIDPSYTFFVVIFAIL